MFRLRTNTQVQYSERSGDQAFLIMQVGPITIFRNKQTDKIGYNISIKYFREQEIDTGFFDENNDPIINVFEVPLSPVPDLVFWEQGADLLASMGALSGSGYTEQFSSLVIRGINYQLDLPQQYGGHPYGLDHTGWTLM